MPGDVKFKNLRDDEKGTNLITSGDNTLKNPGDRKVIGNEMPRYLYGINLGLGYKGFDLSVFMQGTGRRDKWIANTLTFPLYSDFKFIPLYEGLENYWKPADVAMVIIPVLIRMQNILVFMEAMVIRLQTIVNLINIFVMLLISELRM